MQKKIEMGLDAQKSFTQVYEDGNVEDGIWGQVVCLNPLVKKKTMEEVASGN